MTLEQHFKQNVKSDIKRGIEDYIDSVLSDVVAVTQLEDDSQLFLDIDMEYLAARLREYATVQRVNPPDYEQKKLIIESQVGAKFIDLMLDALRVDAAERYSEVNIEVLARDESRPCDPGDIGVAL